MHLAVSTCLIRQSRGFFVFCLAFPLLHPLVEVSIQEPNPSRQSHPRNFLNFHCKILECKRAGAVQRGDGMLRHGGPLPLPGRLPGALALQQHSTLDLMRAGGWRLPPAHSAGKEGARTDRQISVQVQQKAGTGQEPVWMTSGGKSLFAPMIRRARPSTTCSPVLRCQSARDGHLRSLPAVSVDLFSSTWSRSGK